MTYRSVSRFLFIAACAVIAIAAAVFLPDISPGILAPLIAALLMTAVLGVSLLLILGDTRAGLLLQINVFVRATIATYRQVVEHTLFGHSRLHSVI